MLIILPDVSLSQISLPLQLCKLKAGFPSPALDYVEDRLTLNDIVKLDPRYCYLCQIDGDSMIDTAYSLAMSLSSAATSPHGQGKSSSSQLMARTP